MKTTFIGHRRLLGKDVDERLLNAIKILITDGCRYFTVGMHGEFDRCALCACKRLREEYKDIEVEVVITSLRDIMKRIDLEQVQFCDVKTVMYEIEDAHYKQRITLSNYKMIDTCDTVICYVDETAYKSGAKTAMRYAKRKGVQIINLWRNEDKFFTI